MIVRPIGLGSAGSRSQRSNSIRYPVSEGAAAFNSRRLQSLQLKQAFQSHLQETEIHVQRVQQLISEVNDGDVDDKKDVIITALIGSGENIVSESDEGPVRDAGLLATAQKAEHCEIASYGSARDWAKSLIFRDIQSYLRRRSMKRSMRMNFSAPSCNGQTRPPPARKPGRRSRMAQSEFAKAFGSSPP